MTNKDSLLHIATVTDKHFFQGTIVMLYSFLQFNPWFVGEIIIIEDDLDDFMKEVLGLFPNLRYCRPGKDLSTRTKLLGKVLPHYKDSSRKFHVLESFRMEQADQLLYMDSDILCTGDIRAILDYKDKPIVASSDRSHFINEKRHRKSFLSISDPKREEGIYLDCFNSGMFLLNYSLLEENAFDELFSLISPFNYADVQTGHADQYLLNIYFENNYKRISPQYNFLLHCADAIKEKENITISEALMLHYVKSPKPWHEKLRRSSGASVLWHQCYVEMTTWIKDISIELYNELSRRNL